MRGLWIQRVGRNDTFIGDDEYVAIDSPAKYIQPVAEILDAMPKQFPAHWFLRRKILRSHCQC